MKKFLLFAMASLLTLPLMANTTETSNYDPVMGTDLEMNSELDSDADMIEAQEDYHDTLEEERMEENRYNQSDSGPEEMIDYQDRTRTDRERKALNTGSDASDDQ